MTTHEPPAWVRDYESNPKRRPKCRRCGRTIHWTQFKRFQAREVPAMGVWHALRLRVAELFGASRYEHVTCASAKRRSYVRCIECKRRIPVRDLGSAEACYTPDANGGSEALTCATCLVKYEREAVAAKAPYEAAARPLLPDDGTEGEP